MERAGRVLGKLKLAAHGVTEEQLACAAWGAAVGKTIAQRTSAVGLVRTRLIIEVDDAVWKQQLWTLRAQVIGRLEGILGRKLVTELEFRIAGAVRKPPQQAIRRAADDEADAIRDSGLRRLYIADRKKASA